MNTKTTKPAVMSGFSLAIAAAALFAGAPAAQAGNPAASGSAQMGHCMGANACKGQSACKTAGGRFEMPKPASNAAQQG